ncbi:MAG: TlpA family protein disulfide reductase [Bacteroidales bacterium]
MLTVYCGEAAEVHIQARHPEWANLHIEIFTIADPVVHARQVLAAADTDETGFFEVRFSLEETRQIYIEQGVYRLYFYARPGRSYRLILPAFRGKSQDEWLNPYFQPSMVHLATLDEDSTGLNALIRNFDRYFQPVYEELAVQVYGRREVEGVERAIDQLEMLFPADTGFFAEYKQYRLSSLRALQHQQESRVLKQHILPDGPPDWNNPAYHDLFSHTFMRVFRKLDADGSFSPVLQEIYCEKDLRRLIASLKERLNLKSHTLVELIAVKGLYDACHDKDISGTLAAHFLEKLAESGSGEEIRCCALHVHERLTRLMPGSPAPRLLPAGPEREEDWLNNLRGKYIYLVFASPRSYTFLRELPLIRQIASRFGESLQVLVVMAGAEGSRDDLFAGDSPGIHVVYTEYGNEVIERYGVRAFPSYYLIDQEGKMVWAPAPAPLEHFSEKFTRLVKSAGR